MTRSAFAALVFGSAVMVATPVVAHAQTFKVENSISRATVAPTM